MDPIGGSHEMRNDGALSADLYKMFVGSGFGCVRLKRDGRLHPALERVGAPGDGAPWDLGAPWDPDAPPPPPDRAVLHPFRGKVSPKPLTSAGLLIISSQNLALIGDEC